MCDVDILTSQLIELTKQLANSSKSFHLNLKTKDINFSCSSHDRNLPSMTSTRTKRKSPSQKNRDFLRRNTFLKKKMELPNSDNNFTCELCEFSAKSRIQLNIHMVKEHEHLDQLDGNTSLDSPTVEHNDEEALNEEEAKPFYLKFNECKQYATGEIPNSYMKIQLPKPPPKEVMHEMLGVGVFVKTHPFGRMGHIRKETKSHEYTFTNLKEGRKSVTWLYFLDPDP